MGTVQSWLYLHMINAIMILQKHLVFQFEKLFNLEEVSIDGCFSGDGIAINSTSDVISIDGLADYQRKSK